MYLILLSLAAVGHVILWVALVNRLHAFAINRKVMDGLTALCGLALVLIPFAIALVVYRGANNGSIHIGLGTMAAWAYVNGCAIVCVMATAIRLWQRFHPERRDAGLANHTTRINVRDRETGPLLAPGIPTLLGRLPGNQVLDLQLQEKQLPLPRLKNWSGSLRLVHLTDFHMSGRIAKAYFERVVEEVNRAEPDLIALTGDLVERNDCLDWIPDTFGRLRAPGGVYYVLGNHDRKVDETRLKAELAAAGLVHLGGRWQAATVRGMSLILAGNELPWFTPAAGFRDCTPHNESGQPLRIVLAHTPDQFHWAHDNDVDLMLAGHNHGGQVRVPVLGAVLAPSRHGVRYSSGVFRTGNTLMHVSRGTSSLTPFRFNCPPEIAVLVLQAATHA